MPRSTPKSAQGKPPAKTPPTASPGRKPRAPARKPAVARDADADPLARARVLVLGGHPAASLLALMLKQAKVDVALIDVGASPAIDRLVTVNPAFFELHKSLGDLRSTLAMTPVTQTMFLNEAGETAQSQRKKGDNQSRRPDVQTFIMPMSDLRSAVRRLAEEAGVPMAGGTLKVEHVDEHGVTLTLGRRTLHPKLLAVSDPLPSEAAEPLRLPPFINGRSVIQTTAGVTAAGRTPFGPAADEHQLPMCLDLAGRLSWAWLLRHGEQVQMCVQHGQDQEGPALLERWTKLLQLKEILSGDASPDGRTLRSQPMPLAAALERDVVARRTLLLGPAGGFYSASGEDIYPTCWSAKFAAEVAAKAVKAEHPQDALGTYRGRWGATLGDYLRGPQQNLRFLLPLVFRNPVMTDRLADAILLGRHLVK